MLLRSVGLLLFVSDACKGTCKAKQIFFFFLLAGSLQLAKGPAQRHPRPLSLLRPLGSVTAQGRAGLGSSDENAVTPTHSKHSNTYCGSVSVLFTA